MENITSFDCKETLRLMKAGYRMELRTAQGKEEVRIESGKILLLSEAKGITLSEFDFLELYKDSHFFLSEENSEETVDPKKDEEYYSWRQ